MLIRLLGFVIIPVYTLLFTNGYNWFTTNFSVIGNLFDNRLAFLIWGILVGIYFYSMFRRLRSSLLLSPACRRLIPVALLLLFFAITTPYLPEELPLKAFLHIIFAFFSAVLLLLFLFLVSWSQYRRFPDTYWPFLMGIGVIVTVSAVLLIMVGIVSSALEIFVTFSTIFMTDRLFIRSKQTSAVLPAPLLC